MTGSVFFTDGPWIGFIGTALLNWLLVSPHQITLEKLHKIETGMTEAQVGKLLGVPAGNYSYGGVAEYFGGGKIDPKTQREWVGDQIAILIWLDRNGKVRGQGMGVTDYPEWSVGALRREFRFRLGLERRLIW